MKGGETRIRIWVERAERRMQDLGTGNITVNREREEPEKVEVKKLLRLLRGDL